MCCFATARTRRCCVASMLGLLISFAFLATADRGFAAVTTWNGSAADDFWSSAANWDAAPQAGDSLVFDGGGGTAVNDLVAGTAFAGVEFAAGAGPFTLTGNAIDLADTSTIDNASGAPAGIQLDIELLGATTVSTSGTEDINFEAAITGVGGIIVNASQTIDIEGNNTYQGGTALQAGAIAISSDTALGAGGFAISGGSIYAGDTDRVLSNALNIGGSFSIAADPDAPYDLEFVGGAQVTADSTITVAAASDNAIDGTLDLGSQQLTISTSTADSFFTFAGTIIGDAASEIVFTGSGAADFEGDNAAWNGAVVLQSGGLGIASGNAFGAAGLEITGGRLAAIGADRVVNAPLTINGGFTWAGDDEPGGPYILDFAGPVTVVQNSTITLDNAASNDNLVSGNVALGANTLTVNAGNGNFIEFSGAISGTGGLAVTGPGVDPNNPMTIGAIDLVGSTANTFSGGVSISGGGVGIGKASAFGNAANAVTVGPNGAGFAALDTDQVVNYHLNIGGDVVFTEDDTAPFALEWAGDIDLTTDATVYGSVASTDVTLSGDVDLDGNQLTINTTGDYGIEITGTVSDTATGGGIVKNGTGFLDLTGGAYTGGFTLNSGAVGLLDNAAFGTGAVIIHGGAIGSVGGARTITNDFTVHGDFAVGEDDDTPHHLQLNNAITLAADATLTDVSTSSLSIEGTIDLAGNALTVHYDGSDVSAPWITADISGAGGTSDFIKAGTGLVQLSGTNTYAGVTIINAGTLGIDGGQAIPDASVVTVASGATLDVSGIDRVGGLEGGGSVSLSPGNLIVDSDADHTFSGTVSGTGYLNKQGAGTLTLTGPNTYSDDTFLVAGGLLVGNDDAIGSGMLRISDNTSLGAIGSDVTLDNTVLLEAGTDNVNVIGDARLTLDSAFNLVNDTTFDVAAAAEFAIRNVSNGGGWDLIKIGEGLLQLTGINTYGGQTIVQGGVLLLDGDISAGSGLDVQGGEIRLGQNAVLPASLAMPDGGGLSADTGGATLDAGTTVEPAGELVIGGDDELSIAGAIDATNIVGGDLPLTVTRANAKATITGSITNATEITKAGDGEVELAFAYTGDLDVDAGTLSVSQPVTGAAVIDGGSLVLGGGGGISTTAAVNAGGRLVLAKDNAVSGTITVNGGTLEASGGSRTLTNVALGASADLTTEGSEDLTIQADLTVNDDAAITTNGTGRTVINGNLTEAGGARALSKAGPGTLELTAGSNHTFSGGSTVTDGQLILNGDLTTSTLDVQGGELLGDGTVTGNLLISTGAKHRIGNSIGTRNVVGNYTLANGATEEIEVDGNDADKLVATGSITLENGSTIDVVKIGSGVVTDGETFTIYDAGTTLTDNGVSVTDSSAFLNWTGAIDDVDSTLFVVTAEVLVNFTGRAEAGNNASLGAALDALHTGGATAEQNALLGDLQSMDAATYNRALRELAPQQTAAAAQIAVDNVTRHNAGLGSYLTGVRSNNPTMTRHQDAPLGPVFAVAAENPETLMAVLAQDQAQRGASDLGPGRARRLGRLRPGPGCVQRSGHRRRPRRVPRSDRRRDRRHRPRRWRARAGRAQLRLPPHLRRLPPEPGRGRRRLPPHRPLRRIRPRGLVRRCVRHVRSPRLRHRQADHRRRSRFDRPVRLRRVGLQPLHPRRLPSAFRPHRPHADGRAGVPVLRRRGVHRKRRRRRESHRRRLVPRLAAHHARRPRQPRVRSHRRRGRARSHPRMDPPAPRRLRDLGAIRRSRHRVHHRTRRRGRQPAARAGRLRPARPRSLGVPPLRRGVRRRGRGARRDARCHVAVLTDRLRAAALLAERLAGGIGISRPPRQNAGRTGRRPPRPTR